MLKFQPKSGQDGKVTFTFRTSLTRKQKPSIILQMTLIHCQFFQHLWNYFNNFQLLSFHE